MWSKVLPEPQTGFFSLLDDTVKRSSIPQPSWYHIHAVYGLFTPQQSTATVFTWRQRAVRIDPSTETSDHIYNFSNNKTAAKQKNVLKSAVSLTKKKQHQRSHSVWNLTEKATDQPKQYDQRQVNLIPLIISLFWHLVSKTHHTGRQPLVCG